MSRIGHLIVPSHGDIQVWDRPHLVNQRWFSKVKNGIDPLGNFVGSLRQRDVALIVEENPHAGIRILTSSGKTGWINGTYTVRVG